MLYSLKFSFHSLLNPLQLGSWLHWNQSCEDHFWPPHCEIQWSVLSPNLTWFSRVVFPSSPPRLAWYILLARLPRCHLLSATASWLSMFADLSSAIFVASCSHLSLLIFLPDNTILLAAQSQNLAIILDSSLSPWPYIKLHQKILLLYLQKTSRSQTLLTPSLLLPCSEPLSSLTLIIITIASYLSPYFHPFAPVCC